MSEMVKVHVTFGEGDWEGVAGDTFAGEYLWATEIGPDRYRIENIPFFAHDIACGDVVVAHEDPEYSWLEIEKVIVPSHQTVTRVFFNAESDELDQFAWTLSVRDIGAMVERANAQVVAVQTSLDEDAQVALWTMLKSGFQSGLIQSFICNDGTDESDIK